MPQFFDQYSYVFELASFVVLIVGFATTVRRLWFNNDRASAELAVNLMCDWSDFVDRITDQCVGLVGDLNHDEIKLIWDEVPGKVSVAVYADVAQIFRSEIKNEIPLPVAPEEGCERFPLDKLHSRYIAFHWTAYLNRLESILTAWDQGVAREDIMALQFQKLLKNRLRSLSRLNKALMELQAERTDNPDPDKCFPIIERYVKQLENKGEIETKKRKIFGWA